MGAAHTPRTKERACSSVSIIGRVEMLWETGQGSMMCKVKWFYHPEEIETCGRKFDLKLPVRHK